MSKDFLFAMDRYNYYTTCRIVVECGHKLFFYFHRLKFIYYNETTNIVFNTYIKRWLSITYIYIPRISSIFLTVKGHIQLKPSLNQSFFLEKRNDLSFLRTTSLLWYI